MYGTMKWSVVLHTSWSTYACDIQWPNKYSSLVQLLKCMLQIVVCSKTTVQHNP